MRKTSKRPAGVLAIKALHRQKAAFTYGPSKFTFTSWAKAISPTGLAYSPLSSIHGANVRAPSYRLPLINVLYITGRH